MGAPTINAIVIPLNATNGGMVKAMFPNYNFALDTIKDEDGFVHTFYRGWNNENESPMDFDADWWNAPYKRGE